MIAFRMRYRCFGYVIGALPWFIKNAVEEVHLSAGGSIPGAHRNQALRILLSQASGSAAFRSQCAKAKPEATIYSRIRI
ncbi:hypothetical protein [Rhodomicrobium lacus]|uniref:hypothetical protein n=1 Tax=Rhodomicrobium lacus TaxID=2498452 RepID=UPI0026E3944F|nr:hypothetical protein [Rhodomicrobium lacus]WKW50779.1 hypothetical protein QMO75_16170 [Rhodomicrobium lacus]